MRIEWDDRKADANERKHGISFDEAVTALADPLALTITDDSSGERRMATVGMSVCDRILIVVHFEIEEDSIRIISARKATKRERKDYEEGI